MNRSRFEDIPGIPIPEGWRRVSEETVAAACCDFVHFYVICGKYLPGFAGSPGGSLRDKLDGRQGLISFSNIFNTRRTTHTAEIQK